MNFTTMLRKALGWFFETLNRYTVSEWHFCTDKKIKIKKKALGDLKSLGSNLDVTLSIHLPIVAMIRTIKMFEDQELVFNGH